MTTTGVRLPPRDRGRTFNAPAIGTSTGVNPGLQEPPPSRIVHDVPPTWDGKDPAKNLEPYVKVLKGWLATTRTLRTQQGMIIMHYSAGDLRAVIDELEIEDLTGEDGGTTVLKHIEQSYAEYKERKLPQAIEDSLFDNHLPRRAGESMLQYCHRRHTLFKHLKKEGWEIPDIPMGYILYRDARLTDSGRDLIEIWSQGEYGYEKMQVWLKKLERPIPGTNKTRMSGTVGYVDRLLDDEEPCPEVTTHDRNVDYDGDHEGESLTFMEESLFTVPDSYDDDVLEEVAAHYDDPDIVYVAGDIPDDVLLSDDRP